ncbi:MAG: SIMPL domain-containing protein [Candidatus Omnitrophica bacterium]|nr:SIMPL domain-containing protein [Candidatus Omnitrophota bacterium]
MKKGIVAVSVAVILGASLIIVANIGANTAINIKNKGYVTVKGYAKQNITSDYAIFNIDIVSENPDIKACYATLAEDKNKILSYLVKHNILKDEIEIKPAYVEEEYKLNDRGYKTDEFIKYIIHQTITIKSKDVAKVRDLSANIVEILNQGVKVLIDRPQYIYRNLEDLKIEMVGRSTNNARERAITIAKEGKFRLGSIADVRVGVFQITPENSMDVSNYGINDTTSIEKEIKCVVEIQYFVK